MPNRQEIKQTPQYYSMFYTYSLMYGLPDDDLWKIETHCGCNILIVKLHTDIVNLGGFNKRD